MDRRVIQVGGQRRYDLRRWATVFTLGMYAACSFTVGQVAGSSGISRFGQVET